jgi:hypothetical protein
MKATLLSVLVLFSISAKAQDSYFNSYAFEVATEKGLISYQITGANDVYERYRPIDGSGYYFGLCLKLDIIRTGEIEEVTFDRGMYLIPDDSLYQPMILTSSFYLELTDTTSALMLAMCGDIAKRAPSRNVKYTFEKMVTGKALKTVDLIQKHNYQNLFGQGLLWSTVNHASVTALKDHGFDQIQIQTMRDFFIDNSIQVPLIQTSQRRPVTPDSLVIGRVDTVYIVDTVFIARHDIPTKASYEKIRFQIVDSELNTLYWLGIAIVGLCVSLLYFLPKFYRRFLVRNYRIRKYSDGFGLLVKGKRAGSADEAKDFLDSFNKAYQGIATFLYSPVSDKPNKELFNVKIKRVAFSSPGFWEFLGKLSPLEVIREFLNDVHNRRKDTKYREHDEHTRNTLEHQKMILEQEVMKIEVIKQQVALLQSMNIPPEEIRHHVLTLVVQPVYELTRFQTERKLLD